MKCRVLNCPSIKTDKTCKRSFFSFPANDAVAKVWVDFCRRKEPFNLNTSAICEKHFTDNDFQNLLQFQMGFAKTRLLKRGAVPTIFEESVADVASQPQDEICEEELVSQSNSEGDLVYSINENLNESGDAAVSPNLNFYYGDCSLSEVQFLESEIKTLKREKAIILKRNEKQRYELASLRRRSDRTRRKYAWIISSLQTRLKYKALQVKNMEETVASIFTKGQIAKLKAGSRRRNWSKEDIAQAVTLYAASPKAYKLLYSQNFPLPGVRTIQCWSQKKDQTPQI